MSDWMKTIKSDLVTLASIGVYLSQPRLTKTNREQLRRELAGVIAHCENLRLALDIPQPRQKRPRTVQDAISDIGEG